MKALKNYKLCGPACLVQLCLVLPQTDLTIEFDVLGPKKQAKSELNPMPLNLGLASGIL